MRLDELTDRYTHETSAVVVEIDTAGQRREMTHADIGALAATRAEQLTAAGVRAGQVVGIRARNGIDWISWDLAALAVGAVLHAFADETELGDPATLLTAHGLALLVTDDVGATAHKSVFAIDGAPEPGSARDTAAGTDPDLHSLVHSSGTSGRPKGLRISRRGTEYVITRFIDSYAIGSGDRHLIFLPLANYQQRLSVYCCLWTGADLILAPYQRVFAALRTERPTFVIGPPVFYDTVLWLFGGTGGGMSLGEFLGGRIRFMITGMAPIRRSTLTAFADAGVQLLEAYGMTESGMIAWNTPTENRPGSVGRLIDPDAVRFLPDGELLIDRSAPLSTGYFDAGTDVEVFRADGAIATGDYGRLDGDGYLTLVGRKKDVIALSSGRKVHPTQIEAAFAELPGVADLVVVPTPTTNRLGAIITPSAPGDLALRTVIRRGVEDVNRTVEVFCRVSCVLFTDQPLRGDARFMTANMKLSRAAAAAYFAEHAAESLPLGPGE